MLVAGWATSSRGARLEASQSEIWLPSVRRRVMAVLSDSQVREMQTMRRAVVLVVTVCVFITACSQITGKVAQPEYLVFVLAGGSNMVGRGDTGKLPANLKDPSKNIEFYEFGRQESMTAHSNFGPEITFADEITKALPNQKLILIKRAQDNTPLYMWSSDRIYKGLIDDVKKATDGKSVEFASVLWYGGGADVSSSVTTEKYLEDFRQFIERLRTDIGSKDLPFIYARIDPPQTSVRNREQVRQAQELAEQKIPNMKMISADGLSKLSDNLHFDTDGQIELGKRFAQAYLQISKR